MSTTIGRVDFIAGLDGTVIPSQARRLGRRIGEALSSAARQRFLSGIGGSERDFDLIGERLGERLAQSLGAAFRGRFQTALGDAGASMRRALDVGPIREDIGELIVVQERAARSTDDLGAAWRRGRAESAAYNMAGREGVRIMRELGPATDRAAESTTRLGRAWSRVRQFGADTITQYRQASRETRTLGRDNNTLGRIASRAFAAMAAGGFALTQAISSINDGWRGMTHGVRQFAFYVVLFMNLATQIAVLGSAAGSGLTIFAGAAFQGAIGLGVMIAALAVLFRDLEEIPVAVRPAAEAFKALGDTFKDLQNQIAERALSGLEPAFQALNGLVQTLTPSILLVADAVGRVIEQLVNMLTSANGVEVLKGLVEGSVPVFENLMSAAFNLAGALGNIFLVGQPYIERFAVWLNEIMTQFNTWTQSLEGRNALQEWFENGMTVWAALGDLLAVTGQLLNALVTEQTVAGLVAFMGIIGDLMEPLGMFLIALSKFSIFNIIAQLLVTVFQALSPLMPLLGMVADAFSTLLGGVLVALTPVLQGLVTAFVALAEPIVNAVLPVVMQLLPLFVSLMESVMPLVEAVAQLAGVIGEALAPFLGVIVELVLRLIEAFLPLIEAIIPPLIAVITLLAEALGPILAAVLEPAIELVDALLAAFLPLIPTIIELVASVLELITPLLELIGPILPPLTALLKLMTSAGVMILTTALKALIPGVTQVVGVFRDLLMPIINGTKGVLQGLGDFISGVFTGNWSRAWDGIKGIFTSTWDAMMSFLRTIANNIIRTINSIIGGINAVGGAIGLPQLPKIPQLARGGVVWQSMLANIGEAGPEMVVPLRRPLGMIDPQVREVAAFAQGKGGRGGPGTQVIIEPGGVTVVEAGDPARTAQEVVDRVAEQVGG